jgi:hypothetical protein
MMARPASLFPEWSSAHRLSGSEHSELSMTIKHFGSCDSLFYTKRQFRTRCQDGASLETDVRQWRTTRSMREETAVAAELRVRNREEEPRSEPDYALRRPINY